MKNYLYILCAFLLAFAGCTKDADVEPIAPAPDGNTQVVLTGFSGRGTRTGFGGAEDGAVPFLWSAGDYIWARNTRSEAIAEGGSQATFVFESLETADTYDVFYNLTGPAAATALIPAEQTQQAAGELNLGQNGDFGYATAQNGTFTLEHATSYVWFDTYSSDVTSNLLSITLSVSGGQTIAGEAAFADGKLGDCKGSSSVTLSFGEEGVPRNTPPLRQPENPRGESRTKTRRHAEHSLRRLLADGSAFELCRPADRRRRRTIRLYPGHGQSVAPHRHGGGIPAGRNVRLLDQRRLRRIAQGTSGDRPQIHGYAPRAGREGL